MARKPKPQPFSQSDLMNEELNGIIVEFGLCMQRAERGFIARKGTFTPAMESVWWRYREWCQRMHEHAK